MRKVIGIASEGPTDLLVLKTVINKITGEDNIYRSLQPEPNMMGQYGNGWKGVWKWCRELPSPDILMKEIQPNIDLLVIQMDGDVVRKEKEVHCLCDSTECDEKGKLFPLYCERAKDGCPVNIPCGNHTNTPDDNRAHTVKVIKEALNIESMEKIIITIPCDSTDAWVVAAYEQLDDIEKIEDPWKSIISKKKYYHDVRVRGDKKNTVTYSSFMKKLSDNWNIVMEKCESARLLEQEIKKYIIREDGLES